MRKGEKPLFAELMRATALRLGRDLTHAEIETWWETFRATPLDELRDAFQRHADAGRGFPTPPEIQRALRIAAAGDKRCAITHSASGARCSYIATISVEKRKPTCRCHYRLFSVTDDRVASDRVVDGSASRPWEEVFAELGKTRETTGVREPAALGKSLDDAIDEANVAAALAAQEASP